ncbi:hypothetical protein ASG83_07055 [Yonghaparkia sp. Soil809]|nr:hypothetical protein ASC54_00585 [Yonghaparkia sp. Root332]KRF33650.1 hypothetical protein ASG83_07055 [Yonghaparkia sp. Soil809]
MVALDPRRPYSRQELLDRVSRQALGRALADGTVLRARRGVYVSRWMPAPARQAAVVGGRLTCVSALALLGCFEQPGAGLHVQVAPDATRLRRPAGSGRDPIDLVLHWVPLDAPPSVAVASPSDAIRQLLRCLSRPRAIAVLDSALHRRVVTHAEVDDLVRHAPHRLCVELVHLDGRSESGIESLVRVALRDVGLAVDVQVVIPGVGRVDLLVEGRVVVEVDGRRWHEGEQERDYWRDLQLARHGYIVVRVDYAHVVSRIDTVVEAVLRATSRAAPAGVHVLRRSAAAQQ